MVDPQYNGSNLFTWNAKDYTGSRMSCAPAALRLSPVIIERLNVLPTTGLLCHTTTSNVTKLSICSICIISLLKRDFKR